MADGEVGELWLKGPGITRGYWRQPDATAAAFHDGWLRTGDAAVRETDGMYRLVDRWKDMYISGGENVYPAEVEAVIALVPGVAEAAVVGVPSPRWGETGCAFVVAAPGAAPDEAAIHEICGQRLAAYKRPGVVRFVAGLPRTASGKVRKGDLRRIYETTEAG
jgi:fatty-acyl-CoA synthase